MYTRLLIASLLQAVLAQHIPRAKPFHRPHISPGRQFNFRNPDRENFAVDNDARRRTDGVAPSRPHADANYDNRYEHDVTNNDDASHRYGNERELSHREHTDRSDRRHDEYLRQNIETGDGAVPGDNNYANIAEINANSDRKFPNGRSSPSRERSAAGGHTLNIQQNTLKTNLDSQPNVRRENTSERSTKYNRQFTVAPYRNGTENEVNEVVTNENSTSYGAGSGLAYSEISHGGRSEVRNNNHSFTFVDIPAPTAPGRPAVDDVVKYNNNDGSDDSKKEDAWVWGKTSTTSVPEKLNMSDSNLDDRVLFDVDACPAGKAKVAGVCVPKH